MNSPIKIALVEDHVLFRSSLAYYLNGWDVCKVIYEASNGLEFITILQPGNLPDIVILDLNMPVMDGYDTAAWIKSNHPGMKVLMLTMYDSEFTLIRLLQAGVKGFLKKDIDHRELRKAIQSVSHNGNYYSISTAGRLANLFEKNQKDQSRLQDSLLEDQQMIFLKYVCSDLTYKEIAQKMELSPRAIDALRDHLFLKLNVKSRVGLAMIAMKNGMVRFPV